VHEELVTGYEYTVKHPITAATTGTTSGTATTAAKADSLLAQKYAALIKDTATTAASGSTSTSKVKLAQHCQLLCK
jgi:hypothetical protein